MNLSLLICKLNGLNKFRKVKNSKYQALDSRLHGYISI